MKVIIINGSARKGNTLTAIEAFVKKEHLKKTKLKSLNLTNLILHHARAVVPVNVLRDV